MGYDSEVVLQANEIFRLRRITAAEIQQAHRTEVYKKIPRIKEIDRQISKRYSELIQNAFSGKAPTKAEIKSLSFDLRAEKAELLVENGFPIDYLDMKYMCKKCSDEGYVNRKMCTCYQRELVRLSGEKSKLASLLSEQTFKNFKLELYPDIPSGSASPRKQMEKGLIRCKEYAEKFSISSGNLFFNGPTGLGKTFLSSCIAGELIGKGFSVVYDSVANIISRFESVQFNKGGTPAELNIYDDCDLLIIDDLGTEFITQFSESVIYTLLNNRINAHKPIIVSSNLDQNTIQQYYSQSIVSRLTGEFSTIPFTGSDIRIDYPRKKK